jgi:anaerobic selenocysteine-containing dehydrogenase
MEKRGWCGPCHHRCGLNLKIENGKAVSVNGDKNHPMSRGFMCGRGKTILEHLYHKDRLNYPLKRVGDRGGNEWKRISWDEALDEIADRLGKIKDKFGAESLVFSHGTYRTYGWPIKRFFNLFGSPNITGAQSICRCPSWTVEWTTYGSPCFPDMRNTSLIVLFGSHPKDSCPHPAWTGISRAKEKGVKLIVADPMKNAEAEVADIWLPLRPGTDLMIMLSWIKLIIEEGFFDEEFVEKWCYGFDRLAEMVRSHSHDEAERITGVSKDLILSSGRLFATTKPAVIPWGLGVDKQGINAQQVQRARLILSAITGNIDIEGGELVGRNGLNTISDYEMELNEKLDESQKAKQLGAETYRLMAYPGWEMIKEAAERLPKEYSLPPVAEFGASAHARVVFEAMLTGRPYPVKAFFSQASNPVVTLPNPKRNYEAISKAELVVVMDYYITPTAALADFVLPAACTLERADVQDIHGFASSVIANPKAFEPLYDRKDDYFLWQQLGRRLGYAEYWPWETMEDALDYRLEPAGLSFRELCERYVYSVEHKYRKYEQFGFSTSTGKVELYSTIFEKLDLDPLPVYQEPPESPLSNPVLSEKYPLILLTGTRFMPMYHSELRQIESARKQRPHPYAIIHPATAKEYGISDGEWIAVENNHGNARFVAKINEAVQEKMVHIEHGWWFPEREGIAPSLFGAFESNANNLCPDKHELVSKEIGTWPHTALLCRISKR